MLENPRCKNRKYRNTTGIEKKADSERATNRSAKELFIENFVPNIAVGLAKSVSYLLIGLSMWVIKALFFEQDFHEMLETLSNFFYKIKHCEVKDASISRTSILQTK